MPRKAKSQVFQAHTQEEQTPQEQIPEKDILPQEPSLEVDSNEKSEGELENGDSNENTEPSPEVEQEQEPTPQEQEPTPPELIFPALPEIPSFPSNPDTSIPQPQEPENTLPEDISHSFIDKITQSLEKNQAWKEQVHLTLQGLSVLLERFNSIKHIFEKSYNLIKEDKEILDSKKDTLNSQYNHFLSVLNSFNLYFNSLKESLNVNMQVIIKNMNVCIEQAFLCEQSLIQTQTQCNDILGYREDILLTLEKLKALEAQREELLQIYAKGKTFIAEITLTQQSILESLSQKLVEIKAELSTHSGDLHTRLQKAKELLEADLQAQEINALNHIKAQIRLVDSKITELEQNFLNKKAQLDLAHQEITAARATLENAKVEFENKNDECIRKLQESTDNHTISLNNVKESHIISLNEATRQHSENLEELKTNYKQELDSVCAGEIAILKRYIEQIQARTTQFGANFKRVTYLENATFTPPEDNIYYYVFLQGGSGADNSVTQGGITSFGTHLSARGGLGGKNGKGMRGECVSGFVEVQSLEPISVSVGQGGICIVSYTSKEAQ